MEGLAGLKFDKSARNQFNGKGLGVLTTTIRKHFLCVKFHMSEKPHWGSYDIHYSSVVNS